MADQKLSELAAADPLVGTELVYLVQDGASVQATAQDVADLGFSGDYDDLSNKPTLGTAAAEDADAFATAAQGALADSAVQPEALVVLTQAAYDALDPPDAGVFYFIEEE